MNSQISEVSKFRTFGFGAVLWFFTLAISITCVHAGDRVDLPDLWNAKLSAIAAIGNGGNSVDTVEEISLPPPIRELLPGVRVISIPYNSQPQSWGRVAVDSNGKTYVLAKPGTTIETWNKDLSQLLLSQELVGTTVLTSAKATVVATFLTYSEPNLISWLPLAEIKDAANFEDVVEEISVVITEDGGYKSSIDLLGKVGAKTASMRLNYNFNSQGKMLNIQREYVGPYFQ